LRKLALEQEKVVGKAVDVLHYALCHGCFFLQCGNAPFGAAAYCAAHIGTGGSLSLAGEYEGVQWRELRFGAVYRIL
jgi:hypothetical protein